MSTADSEPAAWRPLPESLLELLSNSVGQRTLRFTAYKIRTRWEPDNGSHSRPPLHEGLVSIEGQRYRAEYVVQGWRSDSGQQVEVEAMPLEWEDHGDPSVSTQELGSLTGAVVDAHRLVTALIGGL